MSDSACIAMQVSICQPGVDQRVTRLHKEKEEGLLLVGSKGHDEHAPVDEQGCAAWNDRSHLLNILHVSMRHALSSAKAMKRMVYPSLSAVQRIQQSVSAQQCSLASSWPML